jgi:hypothetical protein
MFKIGDVVKIRTLKQIGDMYNINVELDTKSGEHSYYIANLYCYIALDLLGSQGTVTYIDEDGWVDVHGYLWHPTLIKSVPIINITRNDKVELKGLIHMLYNYKYKISSQSNSIFMELSEGREFVLTQEHITMLGQKWCVEDICVNEDDGKFGVMILDFVFPQEFIEGY